MVKKKTLSKPKKSLKNTKLIKIKKNVGIVEYSPTEKLLDENLISRAIWECLKDNDPQGIMEIIEAHIAALNKAHLAKKANIARSTLYQGLKAKNPTIATLAKLINAFV